MNELHALRNLIEVETERLGTGIPFPRESAIVEFVRQQDRFVHDTNVDHSMVDLVTGPSMCSPGWNMALAHLVVAGPLTSPYDVSDAPSLPDWVRTTLGEWHQLVRARIMLAHCEAGFMRLRTTDGFSYDAWISSKVVPADWRERADMALWARILANELHTAHDTSDFRSGSPELSVTNRARFRIAGMAWQVPYRSTARVIGIPVEIYQLLVKRLLDMAIEQAGAPFVHDRTSLFQHLAEDLPIAPEMLQQSFPALVLHDGNTRYHAASPGAPAPPMIAVGSNGIVISRYGLESRPFLFLARELRRQDAAQYHNAAIERESAFRDDLNHFFSDRRFVVSDRPIVLRRTDGKLRTDIDAAVFDKKTNSLALFELKSQDPLARSASEMERRKENVLYANRQVSGMLAWLNRNGPDEILHRIDWQIAKRHRVQRVFVFVLCRYLVPFDTSADLDHRAAWGSWPQVLRLAGTHSIQGTAVQPIAALFRRLQEDKTPVELARTEPSTTITLGSAFLTVHRSRPF